MSQEDFSTPDLRFSSTQATPPEPEGETDPFREVAAQLLALKEYALHFTAAKIDEVRIKIRNLLIAGFAGLIGFVVVIAVISSLCIYLLRGAAGGISAALGGREWIGDLLTGFLGLAVLGVLVSIAAFRMRGKWRRERSHKYEELKAEQRRKSGGDVQQAARDVA